MIDFTHKKRPDFIQLVLIIAVACLALGAITPAVSAVDYDWEFSVQEGTPGEISGTIDLSDNQVHAIPNALPDGSTLYCHLVYFPSGNTLGGIEGTLTEFIDSPTIFGHFSYDTHWDYQFHTYVINVDGELTTSQVDEYVRLIASFLLNNTDVQTDSYYYVKYGYVPDSDYTNIFIWSIYSSDHTYLNYSYDSSPRVIPFHVDVVDSGDDYQISVSGFDGTQLAGSAYTIAVSTYSGGYNLPLTSFPMYLGDSPVHFWTSDQIFTLPVYLADGVTPIDYYCVLSFPADPTATGYPFWWNMTTHGSLEYPFNTTYPPVVLPTPTPIIPSDIIPDPESLNNIINITGWYQDQGYEGNNITAPIYSGLRGWFNENLVPVIDFFLTPTNYVATVISDSAETSTDGISYITEELGSYAAPFNTVGAYVVRLVPEVVWLVVFAALSIGYVVLLIRISTGSIRDTIGRFLGGK